jgi:signal recognition particle receptor subunit beta
MNLFKNIYLFFRRKRNKDSDNTARYKTKRTKQKGSTAKRKFANSKQKAKIFVPPSFQDTKTVNNGLAKNLDKVNETLPTTKYKSNKAKQKSNKRKIKKAKQQAKFKHSTHVRTSQAQHPTATSSKINNKVRVPSQLKLVITGSVGAGKTTAIASLSDKEPITTEARPTDEVALLKATTTTSMDYGTFQHSLKSKIHLYGTPGQKRFGFMGTILTEGASGLIVLINNNQKHPLNDLSFYLQHNEEFLQSNHAAIGITHFDVDNTHSITEYTNFMASLGMQWPVVPIDARKDSDVLMLVDLIIDATFRTQALEV